MLLELPGVREASPTLLAGVELLSRVDLDVRLQLIRLVELPVTVHTFKGLLAGVDPHVSIEVPVCSEGLAALIALVRFFPRVNPLVLLQAPGVEKPFPTDVTNERLLSRVASLVVTIRVLIVEGLPTYATVELLVLAVALFMQFE